MSLVDGENGMERALERAVDASGTSPGLRVLEAGEGTGLCMNESAEVQPQAWPATPSAAMSSRTSPTPRFPAGGRFSLIYGDPCRPDARRIERRK